jgi:hypothetical protein
MTSSIFASSSAANALDDEMTPVAAVLFTSSEWPCLVDPVRSITTVSRFFLVTRDELYIGTTDEKGGVNGLWLLFTNLLRCYS